MASSIGPAANEITPELSEVCARNLWELSEVCARNLWVCRGWRYAERPGSPPGAAMAPLLVSRAEPGLVTAGGGGGGGGGGRGFCAPAVGGWRRFSLSA